MLSRYTIYRRRPANAGPLPNGVRQDTRYRTSHVLRPTEEIVEAYLANPTDAAWRSFERKYLALLDERFRDDRTQFDDLARIATDNDVYLGCNCPTKKNPNPRPLPHLSGPGIHEKEVPKARCCHPCNNSGGVTRGRPSNVYADVETRKTLRGATLGDVH